MAGFNTIGTREAEVFPHKEFLGAHCGSPRGRAGELKQLVTDTGFAIEWSTCDRTCRRHLGRRRRGSSSCSPDASEPSVRRISRALSQTLMGSEQPAAHVGFVSAGWLVNQTASSRFGTQKPGNRRKEKSTKTGAGAAA